MMRWMLYILGVVALDMLICTCVLYHMGLSAAASGLGLAAACLCCAIRSLCE